ncbi:MAG: aminopeptidase [Ardenticatenia bacterium]|nr:aminopeptidase [Ardenticatenia bacterium]
MYDERIRKWADILVEYSAPVRAGHEVVIRGTTLAEPLALELVRAVLEREGIPHVRLSPTTTNEYFYRYAPNSVLDRLPELIHLEYQRVDVVIHVLSEDNTRALTNVDPQKTVRLQRARQPISELFMNRSASGELLWSLTLFPTPAYAQNAEMGLVEFTEFVFQACFLNDDDPIARWQEQVQRQQQLIDVLQSAREVHIRGPGTDLRVGVAGRTWINDRGDKNFPGGEVFTGPVEEQVEGHIAFSFPAVHGGREVRDVRLWFEGGRVVRAEASHNEEFLLKMVDIDEGARYVGEFAFGTNYNIHHFIRNTLFDEKIGGTVHMALGRSYPETGGRNVSAIHWDLICDLREEGEVYVDGELFMHNGQFVLWDEAASIADGRDEAR